MNRNISVLDKGEQCPPYKKLKLVQQVADLGNPSKGLNPWFCHLNLARLERWDTTIS
jgi:hypothetical protein